MTDDPQTLYGIAQIETALAGIEVVVNANHEVMLQVLRNMATKQEIMTMSTTISGQLDAAQAQERADLAKLTADIAGLVAAFQGATVGSPVTQAQVDAANALDQTMQTLDASVQAAVTPTPSPTPAPTPDPNA
jgi:hypothetical protein